MSKTVAWSLSKKQRTFLEKLKSGNKMLLMMTESDDIVDEVLQKGTYTIEQRTKLNDMIKFYKKTMVWKVHS